jgi:hypothetical protein
MHDQNFNRGELIEHLIKCDYLGGSEGSPEEICSEDIATVLARVINPISCLEI